MTGERSHVTFVNEVLDSGRWAKEKFVQMSSVGKVGASALISGFAVGFLEPQVGGALVFIGLAVLVNRRMTVVRRRGN